MEHPLQITFRGLEPTEALTQAVEDILAALNLSDKPRITALNKIDLLLDDGKTWGEEEAMDYLSGYPATVSEDTVLVSAARRWGLLKLLELISRTLPRTVSPL